MKNKFLLAVTVFVTLISGCKKYSSSELVGEWVLIKGERKFEFLLNDSLINSEHEIFTGTKSILQIKPGGRYDTNECVEQFQINDDMSYIKQKNFTSKYYDFLYREDNVPIRQIIHGKYSFVEAGDGFSANERILIETNKVTTYTPYDTTEGNYGYSQMFIIDKLDNNKFYLDLEDSTVINGYLAKTKGYIYYEK